MTRRPVSAPALSGLAGTRVVEAVALPRQRGEVDGRRYRESARCASGDQLRTRSPNRGVGDAGGAPCMHGRKRGVDRVGDTLRTGARLRCGGVGTPVLFLVFVPICVIAHLELDVYLAGGR